MIENRLIKLSRNKSIFEDKLFTYQNALDKSNLKHKLTYTEDFDKKKRKRSREIIYFSPPFCESVKTNVKKNIF